MKTLVLGGSALEGWERRNPVLGDGHVARSVRFPWRWCGRHGRRGRTPFSRRWFLRSGYVQLEFRVADGVVQHALGDVIREFEVRLRHGARFEPVSVLAAVGTKGYGAGFDDGCKAGHITSWCIRNVIHVLVLRRHMMNTRGRSRTFGNGPRRCNLHLGWTTRTGLGLHRLRVPQRCRVRGLRRKESSDLLPRPS